MKHDLSPWVAKSFLVLALTSLILGCASQGAGDKAPTLAQAPENNAPAALPGATSAAPAASAAPHGSMPPLSVINDPIEPVNRGLFSFNRFLIDWVVVYYEDLYRLIFPAYVRTGIGKMSKNLAWPDRFVASLLRGRFGVASVETGRFLTNTTVGLLGFYDPAVHIGMRPHVEDFGKTFYAWGSGPWFAFQIPLLGPSNGRDAFGDIFDAALAPGTYIPGVSTFLGLNDLSFKIDDYRRLLATQADPYVNARDAMALTRETQVTDYQVSTAATRTPSEPTVKAVFLAAQNPKFQNAVKERRVWIAATGNKLTYSCWMQPRPAPLVYVLPGTGGHRLSSSSEALAELAWNQGYSAVVISSTMTRDFLDAAASEPVPGYPPTDSRDVYAAMKLIHRDLETAYPGRVTKTGLLGLSLGGMQALMIDRLAGAQPQGELRFDRVVAVCPPVDLRHALERIDAYYDAPLAWPDGERERRMHDVLLRAALLLQGQDQELQIDPLKPLPFDQDESQFLIGLNFRMILRDLIYESQRRQNLGVLREDVWRVRRQPAYDEIMRLSFGDYIDRFVTPYYLNVKKLPETREAFLDGASLRGDAAFLKSDPRARVFINDDDFLLYPDDIAWLKATLGARLTVMTGGGHLGNLWLPPVQKTIFAAFDGLKDGAGK